MRICRLCKTPIPSSIVLNNKRRIIRNRKFCLKCSPFGKHNTSKYHPTERKYSLNNKSAWKEKYGSKYVIKKRQELKLKLFQYKGAKCEKCGYDKPIMRAYAFHHLDPNKKDFGVSQGHQKLETMKKEVDKCKLLCVRCH